MVIKIDDDIELRKLLPTDSIDIFRTIDSQRSFLSKWLSFVASTQDVADTEVYVESVLNTPEEMFEYVFTIRKNNEFAGLIGFKDADIPNRKIEIGYWLSENHQGQGIMTKSVAKLCEFAFSKLGMNRVQIKCAVGNVASSKIPKRLGFKFEGIERQGELYSTDHYFDLEVFSKLKSDK